VLRLVHEVLQRDVNGQASAKKVTTKNTSD
jgi:hypothetical protein